MIIPPKTLPKKKKQATGAKDLTSFFGKADQEEDEEFVETQRIYITGKVEGYIKNQLEELAEDHGFEWLSSVSKRLDMLVYGENASKLKLEKAEKLGVKIIPWEKFYKEYINKK
ncbi:DNA ligase [subsurface metagenome]